MSQPIKVVVVVVVLGVVVVVVVVVVFGVVRLVVCNGVNDDILVFDDEHLY